MRIRYTTEFYKLYKKTDVRIRNEVDRKIKIFQKDHMNKALNNHPLRHEYAGFRSIDITNDYRVIYEEVESGEESIAYFFMLGTHKELYGKKF
jgi:addiction module RelE/StbE family toxin